MRAVFMYCFYGACCWNAGQYDHHVNRPPVFMLAVLTYLLGNGVVHILPQHLVFLKQRATYYFEGDL